MTAIASLLSSAAAMPPPVSTGAATPSLASFLDLLAPVTADLMPGKRQVDAAPGKTLPVEDGAAKGSEDALAWLGVAAAPAAAMIAPVETPVPGADGSGAQASGSITPAAGTTRVGAMQPSPVEPLVAPSVLPLPGSNGIASMAPGGRTQFASVRGGIDADLPSWTAHSIHRAPAPAVDDVSNNAAVPEQSADRIGDRSFSGESLATHIGTTAYGSDAILTPPLANKGEASLESDARIQPVFALKAARTSLSPAIAFTMQQELTPIGSDVAKNAAVAERSARRIDDQPYASEPLVGHSERSAVGAGAMTTLPHANESKASLMPDAPSSPVPPLDEANPPLPSAIAFITQPAPVSSVGDGSNNAAVPERNVTRTSIAAPGASLGDAEVAGQIGGQAIPRERLGAPVVASIAGADAIATSSGRWSRSDGGSMPQVGSASAPGDAVGAALTSQTLIVEHRFVQMSGVQPRVGIDLPNVPATAPVAVPFSGVSGTAVATPVAETATGEAPLAPAQVTAIGTPVRLAGDVIVSKIGQPTLSPVAPAAIEAPMVVGERVSAAASIVNIDLRPRSGFLPAGVLATGTQVEPRARGAAAPAALVFADAIHHALGERDSRGATDPATALTPVAPALPGVAATGAAQGTLDMRHEHWPAAMIERIVSLRDMAAENDTRLRLSPDMLGTIDVSLRRDGDQVQVQITAEQAQTRQLLADAQPRLAELADARGVKLHLTGGQAGGGGQSGGDASRHHPSPPSSTRRDTAAHDDAGSTERRIA